MGSSSLRVDHSDGSADLVGVGVAWRRFVCYIVSGWWLEKVSRKS